MISNKIRIMAFILLAAVILTVGATGNGYGAVKNILIENFMQPEIQCFTGYCYWYEFPTDDGNIWTTTGPQLATTLKGALPMKGASASISLDDTSGTSGHITLGISRAKAPGPWDVLLGGVTIVHGEAGDSGTTVYALDPSNPLEMGSGLTLTLAQADGSGQVSFAYIDVVVESLSGDAYLELTVDSAVSPIITSSAVTVTTVLTDSGVTPVEISDSTQIILTREDFSTVSGTTVSGLTNVVVFTFSGLTTAGTETITVASSVPGALVTQTLVITTVNHPLLPSNDDSGCFIGTVVSSVTNRDAPKKLRKP